MTDDTQSLRGGALNQSTLRGERVQAGAVSADDRGEWRTDIQNAPKDRPFLVYWNKSDIYGVIEWIDAKWIDQNGDEVMAFARWQLFALPPPERPTCNHDGVNTENLPDAPLPADDGAKAMHASGRTKAGNDIGGI